MEREGVQGNRPSCSQEERRTLAKDGDFVSSPVEYSRSVSRNT
jgi:hypothetical protein